MRHIIETLETLTGVEITTDEVTCQSGSDGGISTYRVAIVSDEKGTWVTDADSLDRELVEMVQEGATPAERFEVFCGQLPSIRELLPYAEQAYMVLEEMGYEITIKDTRDRK